MSPTAPFFDRPQPAAVLKHGILSSYLPPFAMKCGSAAPGKRVAYIDGYAGPGRYADGSPGSPALAVELAEIVAKVRGSEKIDGYFVESDEEAGAALREYLDNEGITWPVYHGDVHDHLAEITKQIDDRTPVFAFLDPFGVNIPLDIIVKHLLSRSGKIRGGFRVEGAATEVLLNFSLSGLRRFAGHLDSAKEYAAKETFLARLDAMLGGEWWRPIWASGESDREERIREGYIERILQLPGGWSVYSVPVCDRLDGPVVYWLLLLSQHEDGAWIFNQAVSLAMEKHRSACIELSGELDLDPPESRKDQWAEEIAANIIEILDDTGTFRIGAEIARVYGSTIGHARELHVRAAVKRLHTAGVTPQAGKGNVQMMKVYRGSR